MRNPGLVQAAVNVAPPIKALRLLLAPERRFVLTSLVPNTSPERDTGSSPTPGRAYSPRRTGA
jgi:hypothetical protein